MGPGLGVALALTVPVGVPLVLALGIRLPHAVRVPCALSAPARADGRAAAPHPGRDGRPGHGSGTTIEQNPEGYGSPVPRTPPTPDWTPATGFPTDALEVPMPTQLG
ncbi:hypothetical protein ACFYYN_23110 [Streptomyces sp. NPDC001902]